MKSIKSKFILLMLTSLTLSCGVIGLAGILSAHKVIVQDSTQIINLLCKERAQNINASLLQIEQSVKTLSVYVESEIDDVEKFNLIKTIRLSILKCLKQQLSMLPKTQKEP